MTPDPVDQAPKTSRPVVLDNAADVYEGRAGTAAASLYLALLNSLDPQDQQWVLDAVTRQRIAEREAEERGEQIARPTW